MNKVPTVIANHSSWLDAGIIMKHYNVAFALAAKFKHVPLFGTLVSSLDSMFIERSANAAEARAKIIEEIKIR